MTTSAESGALHASGKRITPMSKFNARNARAAKATPQMVMEIRRRYAEMESQPSLARVFGLSVSQIGRIVRGEHWKQLPTVPTDQEMNFTTEMVKAGLGKEVQEAVLAQERKRQDLPMVELSEQAIKQSQNRLLAMLGEDFQPKGLALDYDKVLEREEPQGTGMERLREEANRLTLATITTTTTNVVDADKLLNELDSKGDYHK